MSSPDDLSLYCNEKLRSSVIVLAAWNLIESNILYAMGLSEHLIMTVYIDNDSIILTISSDTEIICSVRKSFIVNHVVTTMTDLSITATINLINSDECNCRYTKSAFYFEVNNEEDDGSIEIECDAYYDISTYNDFKLEVVSTIVKELQYLIHRNILNSDIATCKISELDSKLEVLTTYMKIKNTSSDIAIQNLLKNKKIKKSDVLKLKDIIRRIEIVRQSNE